MRPRTLFAMTAAVLLLFGCETVRARELDKRTPVTLYNFLDDGARRLEEADSETAHATAASLNGTFIISNCRTTAVP